jgi:hypothetical protein
MSIVRMKVVTISTIAFFLFTGMWLSCNDSQLLHGKPKRTEEEKKKLHRLISIVLDADIAENDRPKFVDAILKLGEMKAIEVADLIVDKLDFHMTATGIMKNDDIPGPEDEYPAVKALLRMGAQSIPYIIKAITCQSRSKEFIDNAYFLIWRHTGNNENALKRVQKEMAACQKRLQTLLDRIPKGD